MKRLTSQIPDFARQTWICWLLFARNTVLGPTRPQWKFFLYFLTGVRRPWSQRMEQKEILWYRWCIMRYYRYMQSIQRWSWYCISSFIIHICNNPNHIIWHICTRRYNSTPKIYLHLQGTCCASLQSLLSSKAETTGGIFGEFFENQNSRNKDTNRCVCVCVCVYGECLVWKPEWMLILDMIKLSMSMVCCVFFWYSILFLLACDWFTVWGDWFFWVDDLGYTSLNWHLYI